MNSKERPNNILPLFPDSSLSSRFKLAAALGQLRLLEPLPASLASQQGNPSVLVEPVT